MLGETVACAAVSLPRLCIIIIIIIMYNYYALINALSAHTIHINLKYNILYTHACMHTVTHTSAELPAALADALRLRGFSDGQINAQAVNQHSKDVT